MSNVPVGLIGQAGTRIPSRTRHPLSLCEAPPDAKIATSWGAALDFAAKQKTTGLGTGSGVLTQLPRSSYVID